MKCTSLMLRTIAFVFDTTGCEEFNLFNFPKALSVYIYIYKQVYRVYVVPVAGAKIFVFGQVGDV